MTEDIISWDSPGAGYVPVFQYTVDGENWIEATQDNTVGLLFGMPVRIVWRKMEDQ